MTFTATPIFEAAAQVLIEAESQNVVLFKEVIEQERASVDFYQTQYRILQSRALAKATIDALKLWEHPEWGGLTPKPVQDPTGFRAVVIKAKEWARTVVSPLLGPAPVEHAAAEPPPATMAGAPGAPAAPGAIEDEQVTEAEARVIRGFLGRLTINPIRNSRLVDVKFRSTDPRLAAQVADALAKQYIDRNLQVKFTATKEATDWLTAQLSEQRRRVEESEIALQRFREQNDAVSTENSQNIVIQKLQDLNNAVTRAKTDRIQKESVYNEVRAHVAGDRAAFETFPTVAANPVVRRLITELGDLQRKQMELSRELGDRHPEMIALRGAIDVAERRLQAEVTTVVKLIENEYKAALAQENSLVAALEAQKAEALALNRREIGYRTLERDAASNRQIFESLLTRTRETGISSELKTNNVRLVDEADIPRVPIWPQPGRNLMLAALLGGIAAVGLAFFVEYVDNKIKSPDEIRDRLGLACLGLIPVIPKKALPSSSPLINNGVPQNFAEAFRAVRTNVLFTAEDADIRSLVVTSTGPGEGKTLVASNLAAGLALAGQRVLLLDADMRRPRQHEVFGTTQEPGLSNYVAGAVKANDVIRKLDVPGLWLLPAGDIPGNPAELLTSQRFKDLVQAFGRFFDWVIIDSPPVMAVTDASILAHSAGGVLFVVGAEITNVPVALRAVEQLEGAKARFLGAVLNRVNLQRNAFFYSQYYRREYGDYYGAIAKS
jgi:capsular exopolysaccharide synthesis family protein